LRRHERPSWRRGGFGRSRFRRIDFGGFAHRREAITTPSIRKRRAGDGRSLSRLFARKIRLE
jgi:hypothetical protein